MLALTPFSACTCVLQPYSYLQWYLHSPPHVPMPAFDPLVSRKGDSPRGQPRGISHHIYTEVDGFSDWEEGTCCLPHLRESLSIHSSITYRASCLELTFNLFLNTNIPPTCHHQDLPRHSVSAYHPLPPRPWHTLARLMFQITSPGLLCFKTVAFTLLLGGYTYTITSCVLFLNKGKEWGFGIFGSDGYIHSTYGFMSQVLLQSIIGIPVCIRLSGCMFLVV